MLKALHADSITLYLINEENLAEVRSMFQGFADSHSMLSELEKSYVPQYREGVRRIVVVTQEPTETVTLPGCDRVFTIIEGKGVVSK